MSTTPTWKFWPTDGRWTMDVWGHGLCVYRLEDSGYYQYTLMDGQGDVMHVGYCATLEHAQTRATSLAFMYAMSTDHGAP